MTRAAEHNYYTTTAPSLLAEEQLRGDVAADICVVGAGFTGLAAAIRLAQSGARVVVLEAGTVAAGASGRNGGQIHSGQRKEQSGLEVWLGKLHARALWDLAEEGKAHLHGLVEEHRIACELKNGLVIAAHDAQALTALAHDARHLSVAYGYDGLRMLTADETRAALGTGIYPGSRLDSGGGHLHPLKYARGLAAAAVRSGAAIFERSRVRDLVPEGNRVVACCDGGRVIAERAIVACDAYTGELLPELARYIGHVESFITATAPLQPELYAAILPNDAAVADTRHVLDYYRKSADRRLLFAGRESYWSVPRDIAAIVRPRLARVYPQLRDHPIDFAWSGTVGITFTRMPHFGRIGERVLFAHGYSGHGVALSAIGGRALAEAMLGEPERFETFAAVPAKPFPGGALLRRPLITAGLLWYKLMDAF